MKRFVTLDEMIEELTEFKDKNGGGEVLSIGTSSGKDSSFIFRIGDDRSVNVKCIREIKK